MSAIVHDEHRRAARHERLDHDGNDGDRDQVQRLWQWLAVGTLLFCWIAEASLCGQRGF